MRPVYNLGRETALSKLGLKKSAAAESAIKDMIHHSPGTTLGIIIGAGLGLNSLLGKSEPFPSMPPHRIEGNPLLENLR